MTQTENELNVVRNCLSKYLHVSQECRTSAALVIYIIISIHMFFYFVIFFILLLLHIFFFISIFLSFFLLTDGISRKPKYSNYIINSLTRRNIVRPLATHSFHHSPRASICLHSVRESIRLLTYTEYITEAWSICCFLLLLSSCF